jgi:hypothetical protein
MMLNDLVEETIVSLVKSEKSIDLKKYIHIYHREQLYVGRCLAQDCGKDPFMGVN